MKNTLIVFLVSFTFIGIGCKTNNYNNKSGEINLEGSLKFLGQPSDKIPIFLKNTDWKFLSEKKELEYFASYLWHIPDSSTKYIIFKREVDSITGIKYSISKEDYEINLPLKLKELNFIKGNAKQDGNITYTFYVLEKDKLNKVYFSLILTKKIDVGTYYSINVESLKVP